ncbi:MAG: tyrosine-type recombinase/integrase [Burkholderiales bacterium]
MEAARFETLVDSFLEHLVSGRGRSPRTAEAYRLALQRLRAFAGERDPLELREEDLQVFCGPWLHKQGIQALARRPYVAAVRTFYRHCAARREIRQDPARTIPYPKTGFRLPGVMTLANAEKLMWAPDFTTFMGVRDAAMIAMMAGAGLRVGGLVGLNESAIISDQVEGEPRLFLRVVEKGNKERRVPLPAEADLLVRMYLDHPELEKIDRTLADGDRVLFVSTRSRSVAACDYRGEARRMNRRNVGLILKRYGEKAGIPGEQLHPHALRHLFGTELAEGDVDLIVRQRLMGHADAKSTRIYDHTALRRLVREVDRANPLAKMRTPVTELLAKLKAMKPPAGGGSTP